MAHDVPTRRPPKPFEATREPAFEPRLEPPSDTFLFEIAWEVCNQVGGIYQVLRSKASLMSEHWREQYCLVGPYVPAKAPLEAELVPASGWLRGLVDVLQSRGLTAYYGRWLIPGRPRVLLLDHTAYRGRLGNAKYLLWDHHGIDSPTSDAVLDDAITFGEGVRELLDVACAQTRDATVTDASAPQRLIAHFHEWQGGLAIPETRRAGLPVATVFTTHATSLGRYIASNEEGFYDRLTSIDHAAAAARYNLRTQHAMERACAHGAHVLTTVSQITAEECTALLGRKPDLITPNGLGVARYNVGHDFQTFHADFKERLHTFTMGYFFPSYHFDLERTLYFFTSGRFEPHNKGFDLCLEAMRRLNTQLKLAQSGINVVFFIVSPRPTRSLNPLMLEKRGVLNELRQVCNNIVERVGDQLFSRAAKGERPNLDEMIDEYWKLRYRRTQAAFRMGVLPPVVTHILEDDQHDPVLNQIRQIGLYNRPEDPVKIIYHPEFIASVSPFWGIEYEQFVRGCHLGLFPSAYEPWGYTPLECMALGTPAVSSDLAGFGRYVEDNYNDHDQWGLTVLERRGRSFDEAAHELTEHLFAYCHLTRRERVALRNEVEKRSWDFDWSRLGIAYHEAHALALRRVGAPVRAR